MSIFEKKTFSGQAITSYGVEVVARALRANGHEVREFDPTSKNPVIISAYWMQQVYDIIKWRKRYGINGRRLIIGGNHATCYPNTLIPFADLIYLGDGDNWDGANDANMIDTNETNGPVGISKVEHLRPFAYEDVQQTRRTFCEMGRGCKNRCYFCQYGWTKPYRESDLSDMKMVIKRAKTKSIRMFAADRFQHSQYSAIRNVMMKAGKNDTGSDVSVRFLLKHPEYLEYTSKIRVGIEGMSEGLRRSVNKPLSDEQLSTFFELVYSAGIKVMDWYMIYGLPSETKDDWSEFKKLLNRINRIVPKAAEKKYTIAFHWNAFTPSSLTPFQWEASAHGYNRELEDYIRSFKTSNLTLMHKPLMSSDKLITERMLAMRSTPECGKLLFKTALNKSLFKTHEKDILDEYRRIVGMDLHGQWPRDKPMPWDPYVKYDKESLLKISDKVGHGKTRTKKRQRRQA